MSGAVAPELSAMRRVAFLAGFVACLLSSPERAAAQSPDYTTLTSPQSAQNWTLTLGAGLHRQPDYLGSNDYIFRPKPIISLSRGLKSTVFLPVSSSFTTALRETSLPVPAVVAMQTIGGSASETFTSPPFASS